MYSLRIHTVAIALLLIFQPYVSAQGSSSFTKEEYVDKYKDIAIKEMKRSGIPASITLAQGILESGYGNSRLATEANNHFGIKCHSSWSGKRIYEDDDEKNECFRVYDNAKQSFIDHSDFIKKGTRYAFLFEYKQTDYKSWAHGLKKAGYATNPKYPALLIKLIEEMGLDRYDKGLHRHYTKPSEEIFQFNRIMTVMVEEGYTPLKVAKRYDISLKRLRKYNDLELNESLEVGSKIYLQPKRRKASTKFHIVRLNETMKSISQEHGIKIKFLYKRNRMPEGTEPAAGQKLYLRGKAKSPPKIRGETGKVNTAYYKVRKGDTLYSIAKAHGLTVDELKKLNNIESDALNVGDRLVVSQ